MCVGGGLRTARTYGGEADLVTVRDGWVGGDLLGDGVGRRQGFETTEGQSGEKGQAEHGELSMSEFGNSEGKAGPACGDVEG